MGLYEIEEKETKFIGQHHYITTIPIIIIIIIGKNFGAEIRNLKWRHIFFMFVKSA